MKQKMILAALVLSLSLPCCAQARKVVKGNGKLKTETRAAESAYKNVHVGNGIELEVSDAADRISVTCDENLLPYLQTKVEANRLVIRFDPDVRVNSRSATRVVVPFRESVTGYSASGGSRVVILPLVAGERVSLGASGGSRYKANVATKECSIGGSGGSRFDVTLRCDRCSVALSGGSRAELSGSADNFETEMSGGSKCDSPSLSVKVLDCEMSGGSSTRLRCTERFDMRASGGSQLLYTGDASPGRISLSGGSTHRKAD